MSAKNNRVDLFLVNRGQGESAVAFCREIQTEFPGKPVMVYSTVASSAERNAAGQAGAFQYLSTPEELLNVAEIVSVLIANHSIHSTDAQKM